MTQAGTAEAFTIYDELYQTAQIETLAKNLNVFNGASRGALVLGDERVTGDFRKLTLFDSPDLISHRNNYSVSGVNDTTMTDSENIEVKTNLRIGPVVSTLDAFIKKGMTNETFSTTIGTLVAEKKLKSFVQLATAILAAKLANTSGSVVDITSESTDTITHTALVRGLALMGDQAENVVCWVMHSGPYLELIKHAIGQKIYEEAGQVVYGGAPGTLGRPVIITDAGLHTAVSGGQDIYYTLGLVPGALSILQSEPDTIVADTITGKENLMVRIQGEYAANIAMRNVAYSGARNPTPAALATHTNWTPLYASQPKKMPGVVIKSN